MVGIRLTEGAAPSDQVHRQLRGHILSGNLLPGRRLPSVRRLAKDLGLAPGTVARAYKRLEEEGLVLTRTGGGTTVSAAAQPVPAEVLSAAHDLRTAAVRHGLDLDTVLEAVAILWHDEPPRDEP